MRAARTDKGVHAAGNCAHVKLLIKPNGEEEACEEVNRHLPSDIRLFKIQRYLELPSHKEGVKLYNWLKKTLPNYLSYNDNRKLYFTKLIEELETYGFYIG